MPLPVISERHDRSEADLVRLFHKTGATSASHVAEPQQLDIGTAYANPDLPDVWDANQIRDVALPHGVSAADAMREVESHFQERGARCACWVMNPSAATEQTTPMIDHLLASGFRTRVEEIFYLRRTPQGSIAPTGNLKIIPARASYRHTRALANEDAVECEAAIARQLTEAYMAHVDDPHFDALIALRDDRVVAGVGVLAVGELGLIESLYVTKDHRRQGLGRTMMSRALEICARSLFKHVFLAVLPDDEAAISLYRKLGFEPIGQFTRYIAPAR